MRSNRTRRRATVLLAAATALAVAGCTAEKKDKADTAGGTGAPPPAAAIAPGVTADSIKIGIVYPDLSAVKHVMNIDHGDYEATYNALIKKINDAGGINGRKIVPVYGAVNVVSPAAANETCVKLTQDEKVFAVIGELNTDEPLCYVETNKTALVGASLTGKYYAKAQAPWFAYNRGGDEVADGVAQFQSAMAGKKVAVIGTSGEQGLVNETVLPALKNLGVTPVETAIMDANSRDAAAIAQQMGVFIQKFQSSGVDVVVGAGGATGQFGRELEKTSYRPRVLATSLDMVKTYVDDHSAKHDFSTMNNALALGYQEKWTEPAMQECVATVEAAIPDLKGKLVDPDTIPAGTVAPHVSVMNACRNLALFKAIADKAGKDLTYQSFQNAGFSLGSFQVPGYADKANYSQQTPHGALPARVFTFDPAITKFVVAAP
ncbi:ABC transporter substrate-binding protein [Yinghuangia sp. ASG 101]|uniref:ABC transporter substrate-binding protein n=1 Tax=Yinghuangia sp. ASG 101 TaxID=2896848 RepID=UPI001E6368AA|nr:ABC transporter substrate-binding protein [Yinghuangia sp. ASG 101]UGQ11033.1 ABC transporter substrate-binding protein [Yinghuangia sp. ASG 101]